VWAHKVTRQILATVINVPPDSAPSSIGRSTPLNLGDGGVIGTVFQAGNSDGSSSNVEVNISGGVAVVHELKGHS
jgi:hypothetical protein